MRLRLDPVRLRSCATATATATRETFPDRKPHSSEDPKPLHLGFHTQPNLSQLLAAESLSVSALPEIRTKLTMIVFGKGGGEMRMTM